MPETIPALQRRCLLEEWLRYFGAENAIELDLGTLDMIARLVDNGRSPCNGEAHEQEQPIGAAHHGIEGL